VKCCLGLEAAVAAAASALAMKASVQSMGELGLSASWTNLFVLVDVCVEAEVVVVGGEGGRDGVAAGGGSSNAAISHDCAAFVSEMSLAATSGLTSGSLGGTTFNLDKDTGPSLGSTRT